MDKVNNKIEEILKEFDEKFVLTYPVNGKIKQDLKDAGLEKVKQFITRALKSQKDYYEGIIKEMIGEGKKIYNKKEVGITGTHAIASNQHYGYNKKRQETINITKKYNI